MARIRTVKPEFASDGDMLRLSDSCALFFILFWNFCDDEGKHRLDLDQLCGELAGRWRKDKIKKFIRVLVDSGQIQVSSDSEWIQTVNWSHQKIDKPRQPKIKSADIQWLNAVESSNVLESSWNIRRKDRIVEDRKGKDRIACEDPQKSGEPKTLETRSARSPNAPTWEAYRSAYFERYKTEPVRNAKVNSNIAQLVQRLGEEEAPEVARFFVWHNDSFYVRQLHPAGALLKDCESLRTQWARGRAITGTDARSVERAQNNANAFAVFAELDRRGE